MILRVLRSVLIVLVIMVNTHLVKSHTGDNKAEHKHGKTTVEVQVRAQLFLQGPYIAETGRMDNLLVRMGLLPGQSPVSFFSKSKPYVIPVRDFDMKVSPPTYTFDVTDWVWISILSEESETIAVIPALLYTDGRVSMIEPLKLELNSDQLYQLAIYHRNHLTVISPNIPIVDQELFYDFTLGTTHSSMTFQNDIFLMTAGDIYTTGDQQVNDADLALLIDAVGQQGEYMVEDVNLDGDVNFMDVELVRQNKL